jgi:hypothetical protein
MASQQLNMFLSDYEQRSDARDMAAYRALGAMTAAIRYCRDGNTEDALRILTCALDTYERANANLQALTKGENNRHGNRTAA